MSGYVGVEPIPKASLVLTQGALTVDSQTIDIPGGYSPGNIFVYLDGQRLRQSDFTDTDGFTVDLLEVFPAGTEYIVEEVRTFNRADHYTKTEIQNAEFDFNNIPTVGGAPIVESGSNSDGEWTRFADGTQECRALPSVLGEFLAAAEDTPEVYWDFPAAFVATPFLTGSPATRTSADRNECEQIQFGRSGVYEAETTRARVYHFSVRSIPTAFGSVMKASGRWK